MSIISGFNLSSGDTEQKARLGATVELAGATYIYAKASADIAQYALAQIDADGTAAEGTTTTAGSEPATVCIPQFAVTSGEYFWAPCGPFHLDEDGNAFYVKGAASCAKDVKLYTTATAGVVDDAATTLIAGLVSTLTLTSAASMSCRATKRLTVNS